MFANRTKCMIEKTHRSSFSFALFHVLGFRERFLAHLALTGRIFSSIISLILVKIVKKYSQIRLENQQIGHTENFKIEARDWSKWIEATLLVKFCGPRRLCF